MRSRKSPRFTIWPSFTASLTMRPEMSAATSTLVRGCTWPLAVTEATRSRESTASIRTSVGFSPRRAAVVAKIAPPATTTAPRIPHFIFLLIRIPSCEGLAERPAHRLLERGVELVEVVNGVDQALTSRFEIRPGLRHLGEVTGSNPVTLLRQFQRLLRGCPVLLLELNGLVLRDQVSIRRRDICRQLQLLGTNTIPSFVAAGGCGLDGLLTLEPVEDRQRQREAVAERTLLEVEGELFVREAHRGGIVVGELDQVASASGRETGANTKRIARKAAATGVVCLKTRSRNARLDIRLLERIALEARLEAE